MVKTKIKKIIIWLSFFSIIAVVFAISFTWSFDQKDANSSASNDLWSVSAVITPVDEATYTAEYRDENLRAIIVGTEPATSIWWTSVEQVWITSELFWKFIIGYTNWSSPRTADLRLYFSHVVGASVTANDNCDAWKQEWFFRWKITSADAWGNMDVVDAEWWKNVSYYCPDNQTWKIKFHHPQEIIKDKYIEDGGAWIWLVHNARQIGISGRSSMLWDTSNLLSSATTQQDIYSDRQENITKKLQAVSWKLWWVKANIKRNISKLTKNLTPDNEADSVDWVRNLSSTFILHAFTKTLHYFDFEWEEMPLVQASNEGQNQWKILYIQNSSSTTAFAFNASLGLDRYMMEVTGNKTVIVKWGNVYINSDIYYGDANSMLTIVVRRDTNNKINGGNVYINPDVTNIDANIIAEWSILSYTPATRSITRYSDPNMLRRQLMIYWSIMSSNTVWATTDSIPYGTDAYILELQPTTANNLWRKYDLASLRSFYLINASSSSSKVCWWTPTKIIPRADETNSEQWLKYAWAGKRECFNNDLQPASVSSWVKHSDLRGSAKQEAVIIEYNPNISILVPDVLK